MRKPLYNIVIFIFHIITLILLFTLCIHFNVIKLDFLDFSKEAVASFFKNDYVVNIVCTILTAAALYIIIITTLIISKKPGNTGISRDIRTEFTTDLLLSD